VETAMHFCLSEILSILRGRIVSAKGRAEKIPGAENLTETPPRLKEKYGEKARLFSEAGTFREFHRKAETS